MIESFLSTTFGYDAFQRQIAQIDGRGNTTRTVYDSLGRVSSTIDALGYATAYGYDALGRKISVTDPLTNTVTTAYDAEGRVVSQRGATYPVDYSYNEFGEKVSMSTYRDLNSVGDTTLWLYDEASGLVTNKVYADGKGPKYNYTPEGNLATRTWARGEVRNVIYDNYNRVIGISYPFSSTGNVDYQRDRVGTSMRCIVSNLCDIVHVRDEYHYITNEMIHVDEQFYDIKRNYDLYGRNVGFSICETNGCITSVKKRIYDELGRTGGYVLVNAVGKSIKVNCIYDAESKIASLRYVFQNDALLEKRFERELLRSGFVTNRVCLYNSQIIHGISTIYDVLGRPIKATDLSSTAREWLYNNRNELASVVIGTNSYAYAYDSIGNRNWAALNSATNSYIANSLNQYSQVDASQFVYDADGNLTQDARYNYTYDAENRLVSVIPLAPTEGSLSIHNRYDHKGLRIRKIVKRYANGWWNSHATHTFIFDGGNIVLERIVKADGNHITKEYFWGIDKSGTEQDAGGVGGLLAVSVNGVFSIPCYDHNGNIVAYVSETGGIESLYVYDAYGNTIEKSGEKADVHSFGFSTKYHDRETGMVGYQRRFYRPDFGRWLNRDPIEEEGGENLYAFCQNNAIFYYDPNGESFKDVSNFCAGVGDSLTFGLTRLFRRGLNRVIDGTWDDPADVDSTAYFAGEVTEVTVEIAVTLGGAALRHTAKAASRVAVEGGARSAYRRAHGLVGKGGEVHHINPIKGHPHGPPARYPLPYKWAARGEWNLTWYATKAEHNAAHARMQVLEAIDKYRQSTLLTRQSINVIINHLNSGEDTKCWDSLDVRTDIYYYEFENFGVNQNAVPETVTIHIR